jgi:hypothetical protein
LLPRSIVAPAVIALLGALTASPALAHKGNPNYESRVISVTPAQPGVKVMVLNRDDRLEIVNTSGRTVVIRGYQDEPYLRLDEDRTVEVNTDSEAYFLNQDREGESKAPAGVDSKGAPHWKQVSRTGRFEWHDHRMHWMGKGTPSQVRDKAERTKVFDWSVPIDVDGRKGRIAGDLWWTPSPGGDIPLGAIVGFAGLAIALSIAVFVIRRRRAAGEAGAESEPPKEAVEAW